MLPFSHFVRLLLLSIVFCFTLGFTACAPVTASLDVSTAQVSIDNARDFGADQFAPYEYYLARFYLYKAREEQGHAEYYATKRYAKRAHELADEAAVKAQKNPWKGAPNNPNLTPANHVDNGHVSLELGVEP